MWGGGRGFGRAGWRGYYAVAVKGLKASSYLLIPGSVANRCVTEDLAASLLTACMSKKKKEKKKGSQASYTVYVIIFYVVFL